MCLVSVSNNSFLRCRVVYTFLHFPNLHFDKNHVNTFKKVFEHKIKSYSKIRFNIHFLPMNGPTFTLQQTTSYTDYCSPYTIYKQVICSTEVVNIHLQDEQG